MENIEIIYRAILVNEIYTKKKLIEWLKNYCNNNINENQKANSLIKELYRSEPTHTNTKKLISVLTNNKYETL